MHPISSSTAFLMIAVAAFFDLFGLIPFIGILSDILAPLTFGVWFSHHGVHLIVTRPVRFFGAVILEFTPVIGAAPFWTLLVISAIRDERRKRYKKEGI